MTAASSVIARSGRLSRRGDHAMKDGHLMTMISRSDTPERIRRGTRRRARWTAAAVAAALVSVLVPALRAGPAGAAGTSNPVPAVAWHRCPAGSAGAMVGGFSCATVAAPLDYRDPSGPKIRLALVEHPATGPARRGVIFFNPGGPGGASTVQLPAFIGFFPKELLREYDIVSWDPRGSGASTAVQCFPSQAAESAFLWPAPATASLPATPGSDRPQRSSRQPRSHHHLLTTASQKPPAQS